MQMLWLIPSLGFALYLGFGLNQWQAAVFSFASFAVISLGLLLKANREPLSAQPKIYFSNHRVALDNQVLPRWSLLWPAKQRNLVKEQIAAEIARANSDLQVSHRIKYRLAALSSRAGYLDFWAGFASGKMIDLSLLQHGPHAIIIGATGSGKSQLLTLLLRSLTEGYDASQLTLSLIDFKGGATLLPFSKLEHCQRFVTDLHGDLSETFHSIAAELEYREQRISSGDFAAVDSKHLVVIDELAEVLRARGVQEQIESLAARGRSLGVHLVVASQSISGIPRQLIVNLGLRIGLGDLDAVDCAQLGLKTTAGLDPTPNMLTEANSEVSILSRAQVRTSNQVFELWFPSKGAVQRQMLQTAI